MLLLLVKASRRLLSSRRADACRIQMARSNIPRHAPSTAIISLRQPDVSLLSPRLPLDARHYF